MNVFARSSSFGSISRIMSPEPPPPPITPLESPFKALDKALQQGRKKPHSHEFNFKCLVSILKLFQPLLEDVEHAGIAPNRISGPVFERLENAFNNSASILERCCKPGHRVYNVVRCSEMLKKFCDVSEDLGRCIGAIPLTCLNPSYSVKSQVVALHSKLQGTTFIIDQSSQRLSNEIELMVMQHRRGVAPSPAKIKRFAKQLHLCTCEAVLEEDSVLGEEQMIAHAERNNYEEEYLSHVAALLASIRPSDFVGEDRESPENSPNSPDINPLIPSEFTCPLSLEVMVDPVIIGSGQTYERAYITRWFEKGNFTCPITRQRLEHTILIPNFALKSSIASWCLCNNLQLPSIPRPVKDFDIFAQHDSSRFEEYSSGIFSSLSVNTEDSSTNENRPESSYQKQFSLPVERKSNTPVVSRRTVRSVINRSYEGSNLQNSPASVTSEPPNDTTSPFNECTNNSFKLNLESNVKRSTSWFSDDVSCASSTSGPKGIGGVSGERNGGQLDDDMSNSSNEEVIPPLRLRASHRSLSSEDVLKRSRDLELRDGDENIKVEDLVENLQSLIVEERHGAAVAIRKLTKLSEKNRKLIAAAGAIGPLIALLKNSDTKTVQAAVFALLNLSISDYNKNEIVLKGAINVLARILSSEDMESREGACATIFSLSVVDEYKISLADAGVIPLLLNIFENGSPQGKDDALLALYNISLTGKNRWPLVENGAIKSMLNALRFSDAVSAKAVSLLANLATISEGRDSIVENQGIPVLAEIVEFGDTKAKEDSAAALLLLCTKNSEHRTIVWNEDIIAPLMQLSRAGTSRARAKAKALLKELNANNS